ncbi:MAG: homoserine kinase [Gammaproteobacteria bacterium]|nr:homoserine kinase [Gammaproteobacteria bacterium]|tara:strand:- start:3119 stop:4057 length:939 start_codon:yes stop_codon:yes gene_type:complete
MSVYTKITKDELNNHLKKYSLGVAESIEGIPDGIENTNYVLKTDKNEYIFTIFENLKDKEVKQYLRFMNHLCNKGLSCPRVMESKAKNVCVIINGKPSAIIEKLKGASIININGNHCNQIGNLLGDFHLYGLDFDENLPNTRDIKWSEISYKRLKKIITDRQNKIIKHALIMLKDLSEQNLEVGTIHADLFRDNVLFYEDKVSGMIDFYYSCKGFLIYDLAVVINDWCTDSTGSIITSKYKKIITSYSKKRSFVGNEYIFWQHALIAAALRFYLSRLIDLHFPKVGEMTHIKDPNVFEKILEDRIDNKYDLI